MVQANVQKNDESGEQRVQHEGQYDVPVDRTFDEAKD